MSSADISVEALEALEAELNLLLNKAAERGDKTIACATLDALLVRARQGLPKCDLCPETAEYQGWARKLDPFTKQPSGMTMNITVCEEHKKVLIGAQTEGDPA